MLWKCVVCARSLSFWDEPSSWRLSWLGQSHVGVFRYVVVCVCGNISVKIKLWNHVYCGQPHRAPGEVALLPDTENHASCEQNLWLLWMSLNPVNWYLVGGGKGDFFDLLFSTTVTPCAHMVLVQEHRAPRGLKPMVSSIEWEVLFWLHIALPVVVLNGRCSRYYQWGREVA